MGLPLVDIQALGAPVESETIATGTTVVYGSTVYDKGEILQVAGDDGHEVSFVREYMGVAQFGDEWYEEPLAVWASDAEDAQLSGKFWKLGSAATASRFTLDKSTLGAYSLEVKLDGDTDDEIRAPIKTKRIRSAVTDRSPDELSAILALELEIRHIESNAGVNGLQYQIRQELKTPTYWNGSIWTTATWIDVTVSATAASFTDAVTLDSARSTYTIALRNKGTNASETSHVTRVSLHETLTAGTGFRLPANVPDVYVTPYRCRVGAIADNASKELVVSRMGQHAYS